jgi:ABC-2 type transport system ATP-binding protein
MRQQTSVASEASASQAAAAAAEPMVAVRGLRMVYGDLVALDGISFEIREGEIFGFIGPNGAGKTTTIRILSTLLEPSGGSAAIAGFDILDAPDDVRRVIGYMPDEFGVYEGITVWEYLDFFAGAFRLAGRRRRGIIDGVLELTDLHKLRDRMVASLSKGMRQRLCLAKTLIHDPRVLILDEPASAMDPRARIEMRALLKELSKMGKTILISSHILTELSDICSSVGIIERGRILEWGKVDAITGKMRRRQRVEIRFARPWPRAVELLAELTQIEGIASNGVEVGFDYLGEPDVFHAVVKALVDEEAPLLAIRQEAANLEQVFLEVTRGELH